MFAQGKLFGNRINEPLNNVVNIAIIKEIIRATGDNNTFARLFLTAPNQKLIFQVFSL